MKRLNVLIMSFGNRPLLVGGAGWSRGPEDIHHGLRPDGADLSPRSVCGSRERLLRRRRPAGPGHRRLEQSHCRLRGQIPSALG